MTQAIQQQRSQSPLAQPVTDKATLEALISGPNFQDAVRTILPGHLKADRVLKMGLVAASRQPLLYKCTQASFVQALMRSAELGLDCSGTLGLGYLVPYYNSGINGYECQFIPGYRGIIELAKRANKSLQIEARVVHENDVFEFEYGLNPILVHKPTMGEAGEITYFYAISREPGLQPEFTVMTRSEVDAIKLRSKSRNRQGALVGPWVSDYAEMGRKTITKRHAKYLSLSVEVQEAVNLDDEQYRGHQLALANEVAANVGLSAMKERMALVKNGGEDADASYESGAAAPESDESLPDVSNLEEVIDDRPETNEEAAEREAIEAEAIVDSANESVSEMTDEEKAEFELYELRKSAVEVYRDLGKANPPEHLAATKWLGTSSIPSLDKKKLVEFLKKFSG
jgi:recombination protein RecT